VPKVSLGLRLVCAGLYTILSLPTLYGVLQTGRWGGVRTLHIGRAIVSQSGGQYSGGGQYTDD